MEIGKGVVFGAGIVGGAAVVPAQALLSLFRIRVPISMQQWSCGEVLEGLSAPEKDGEGLAACPLCRL